ncbi:hypothetical protein C8R43DRAFT_1131702 [Mycena crocata]|nr:hypothetical protein C8R43DRAFT_1131702 [Mycena crocata]
MDIVLTVYHLPTKVLVDTSPEASKTRRNLEIHLIGAEKELNVIPLFSELAPLIPNTDIVMTFVGQACKKLCDIAKKYPGAAAAKSTVLIIIAPVFLGAGTLCVKINEKEDLYPTEHGSQRPDTLISENTGLFHYRTWQLVYGLAARNGPGIPWGITEYLMQEVVQYEGHMWQIETGKRSAEYWLIDEDSCRAPSAYNGFVLRVC